MAQRTFTLGDFSRGGLLVITVGGAFPEGLTELLAAHQPSHAQR